MPVALPSPKLDFTSKWPSPLESCRATTPPGLLLVLCNATKRSPLGATQACRAAPRLSAATRAQKPCGSLMPPLPGSHVGAASALPIAMAKNTAVHSENPIRALLRRGTESDHDHIRWQDS